MFCPSVKNCMLIGAVLGAGFFTSLVPNQYECYSTQRNYSITFPDTTNFDEECSKRNRQTKG